MQNSLEKYYSRVCYTIFKRVIIRGKLLVYFVNPRSLCTLWDNVLHLESNVRI